MEPTSKIDYSSNEFIEPLLDPKNDRPNLFPIIFIEMWELLKKARACFWIAEEIDFSQDLKDWDSLTSDVKSFLEVWISFFSVFDQKVIKNIENSVISKITVPEARMFYRYQESTEDIHVHTYSLFPEFFIKDEERRLQVLNATENFPVIKAMAEWLNKYTSNLAETIVAMAIVEGVFFSGAFASVFFMKKKGKLPGLCQSNEQIARDEGLHRDFGILLYKHIVNKLSKEKVKKMMMEGIELVSELVTVSMPVELIGINSSKMIEYVKYVADNLLVELIGEKIFNINVCPLDFMNMISLQGKTDFFSHRPTQYSRQASLTSPEDNMIRFDCEF